MLANAPTLAHLSDQDLVGTVTRLVEHENDATGDLVAALGELDSRRLYLGDGCASLFSYCTERLHFSESAAYHRIAAARAPRRFPLILDRLREGALTLTTTGAVSSRTRSTVVSEPAMPALSCYFYWNSCGANSTR